MSNVPRVGTQGVILNQQQSLYKDFPAYDGTSVVTMNSTTLEVVDYSFVHKGEMVIYGLIFCSFFSVATYFFLYAFINPAFHAEIKEMSTTEIILLIMLCFFTIMTSISMLLLSLFFLKKEFFGVKINPVRFNRKCKKAFYFDKKSKPCEINWSEIVFKIHLATSFGAPHKNIIAYKVNEKGKLERLFILGYMADTEYTLYYWEFIRSYMEDDVVEPLAAMIYYCPISPDLTETYVEGFQTLIQFNSPFSWAFIPISVPYYLVNASFRWIIMRVAKNPVWTPEINALCAPDDTDAIHVNSDINTPHRWRYATFSLPSDYYSKMYDKLVKSRETIANKIKNRYG